MNDKEHDDFIPWYRHDTANWLRLSLAARGAMAEIARKLNRRGELRLSGGLPDLALLLRLEWDGELAPAVAELVAAKRIEWDGARFVLIDPEFETRKRKGSAARMAEKRARDRQISNPPSDACDASDVTSVTPPHVTGVTPVLSDLSPLSSDLRSGSQISEQAPGQPPAWFSEVVERVQGDTGEKFGTAEAWIRYAGHRKNKGIPTNANDAAYWLGTVMIPEARKERQRARKFDPPHGAVEHQKTKAEAEAHAADVVRRMRELEAKQRKVGT